MVKKSRKKKGRVKKALKNIFSRKRVKEQQKKRKGREEAFSRGMAWIKKPKRERVIAEGTF